MLGLRRRDDRWREVFLSVSGLRAEEPLEELHFFYIFCTFIFFAHPDGKLRSQFLPDQLSCFVGRLFPQVRKVAADQRDHGFGIDAGLGMGIARLVPATMKFSI